MKKILFLISFIILSIVANATVWTVDSLNNAGYGSLRAAVDSSSNGDTIRFNPNLIISGSDSIILDSSIVFSKALTFKGLYTTADTLFISGGGNDRIFTIDSTTNIILDSLVLVNGNTSSGGGAIYFSVSDTLFVTNSVVKGNYALVNGGGIEVGYSVLEIDKTTIIGNSCGNDGGGIYANSGDTVQITNSTLSLNTCGNDGGGIFTRFAVFLNNSVVDGNYSNNDGGGVCCDASNTPTIVVSHNSIFSNNTALGTGGGALSYNYSSLSTMIMLNTNILNNNADGGGGFSSGSYYGASSITVDSCIISNNTAISRSGGMSVYSFQSSLVSIKNTLITNNSVSNGQAGGIYYQTSSYSGAITSTLEIENCEITFNTAQSGGAIFSTNSHTGILNITNSNISNNTATIGNSGGVYFHSGSSQLNMLNSNVTNNISTHNAGGLSITGNNSTVVFIDSSEINTNTAKNGGGLYFNANYLNIEINNSFIEDNEAVIGTSSTEGHGGGMYCSAYTSSTLKSEIALNNTLVANNTAGRHGGGIMSGGSAATMINIFESTFENNSSSTAGGGIYSYSSHASVPSSVVCLKATFNHNTSTANGGAIYVNAFDSISVSVITSTLVNNQTVGKGGGVFADSYGSSIVEIANSTVSQNSATVTGDGVSCNSNVSSIIRTMGSIIALNGTVDIHNNKTPAIVSFGYNIFSSSTANLNGTDQIITGSIPLNLDTLAFNGGKTKTVMPLYPSVALNSGNPLDTTLAQNDSILQVREIGAAESCVNTYDDVQYACDSLTWIDGVTYYASNDTSSQLYFNSVGCDSIVTLNLTISNLNANYSYVDNGTGNYSFSNSSTGNYTNAHWAFGDGATSLSTNSTHTYSANGTYVVVLAIHDSIVVGDSCISYFTDTIVVTGAANSTSCNAGWVVFADSSTGGVTVVNSSTGTNLTYLWDFGDGDTSNLQFPSHTYTSNGPFNLCLTVDDGNGCSDTYCDSISSNGVLFKNGFDLNVVANYPLGVQNIENKNEVKIYPNPTSSTLNIETQNFKINKILIRDNSGKVVITITSNFNVVNVESLATGVYHIELIGVEETVSKKFIKQ